jgi:hypothetical protein
VILIRVVGLGVVIILVLLRLSSKFIFWVIGEILGILVALGVVLLGNCVIVLVVFVVAVIVVVFVVLGLIAEHVSLELAH